MCVTLCTWIRLYTIPCERKFRIVKLTLAHSHVWINECSCMWTRRIVHWTHNVSLCCCFFLNTLSSFHDVLCVFSFAFYMHSFSSCFAFTWAQFYHADGDRTRTYIARRRAHKRNYYIYIYQLDCFIYFFFSLLLSLTLALYYSAIA